MNLLLDTHSLIWFLNGEKEMSEKVISAIENPLNSKIISIASLWEIAIKISLNKIRFPRGFKHFLALVEENGFEILPVTFKHLLELSTLEFFHRDPFDRLLVAQSIADKLIMVTKDEYIVQYNVKTIW